MVEITLKLIKTKVENEQNYLLKIKRKMSFGSILIYDDTWNDIRFSGNKIINHAKSSKKYDNMVYGNEYK